MARKSDIKGASKPAQAKVSAKGKKAGPSAQPKSAKAVAAAQSEDLDDDVSDQDSEDDEFDGVTEEGMKKLMNLLGEDGLNEYDIDVLSSVAGEGDEEEDDDEEELEYGSGDGSQEFEDEDDEEEDDEDADDTIIAKAPTTAEIEPQTADDLALDELESNLSVDEDAVPARKVTINNRVSSFSLRWRLYL